MKTFTVENILSECVSFEEAIEVAANKQELLQSFLVTKQDELLLIERDY